MFNLANADPRPARIFSSHMMFQRNKPIRVWGWAVPGEQLVVRFNGEQASTKAAKDSSWEITLKPMPAGGPYTLQIRGRTIITYHDILIGDIWVCSGQSNMEWPLRITTGADQEIAGAHHPGIRLFTVAKETSFRSRKDLAGGDWKVCEPASVADFSAVGYYFGRQLHRDLDVPIGLINSSWGGTNIQTWTSWDVMQKDSGWATADLDAMTLEKSEQQHKREAYDQALSNDAGTREGWYQEHFEDSGWEVMQLPEFWEKTALGNTDGSVWFRRTVSLTADQSAGAALLHLGTIDDQDSTWVNGRLVGSTIGAGTARSYAVPAGSLKNGTNVIAVKVTDFIGDGGIYGEPAKMQLTLATGQIPLQGDWKYRPSAISSQFAMRNLGPNEFPSQLYNAMIAPFVRFPVTGVIWYQGESNVNEAWRYRSRFPDMINDWRSKWNDTLPFIWAQLASFMQPAREPVTTPWAELREAQTLTLSLPRTAQAILTDLGETNDIHPRNKKEVGYRMALAAESMFYHQPVISSGPVYRRMLVDGSSIRLTFGEVGGGLKAHDQYGYLRGFAIAGTDQRFVWAQARIEGDQVIVSHPAVPAPVAVRFAWGDNPSDANLYNTAGLPAVPFRTDHWRELTRPPDQ